MKSLFVTGQLCLVVGVLSLSGCSGDSPDGLMKQQIQEMNNMADAMEAGTIETDKEAIEARAKIIADKFEALELTIEEKQELFLRHKDELQKAALRLQKIAMQEMQEAMSGMSGQIGDQMGDAMKQMGQEMKKSFSQ